MRLLDPSLVSHTFVLFTTCLYYALLSWSWLAAWCWGIYVNFVREPGCCHPERYRTGDLPSVCVISIRASGSRASGPRQHGWSPTLPLGVVLLNKTLVNCYTATITFPIHVLSHRSANRTCWDPTRWHHNSRLLDLILNQVNATWWHNHIKYAIPKVYFWYSVTSFSVGRRGAHRWHLLSI